MKPCILITGGLGNLGSWMTEYFCERDYEVFVLANNHRPHLSHLDYTFLPCDIVELNSCKQALAGYSFDFVIHLASLNEGNLKNYPERALNINSLGTNNLLKTLLDQPVLPHFIYFSTFQVYGTYEGTITEQTPVNPKNHYALTHYFAERYVQLFHQKNQFPYTIFRLTNSYGCPKDINTSKWYLILNDLARNAFQRQEIRLRSNGQSPRDFIWMGDVCSITEKVLQLEHPPNQAFNLASGQTMTMLQIAQLVQQVYQEEFNQKIPIQLNQADQSVHPNTLKVDTTLLKNTLSYTLHNMLEDEVKDIFELLARKTP